MSCEGHSHDHEHADEAGASLRPSIDFSSVHCLNESVPGSGKSILKLHEDRLSAVPSLISQEDPDEDPELLLHVPFVESVSIRSISVASYADAPPGGLTSAPTSSELESLSNTRLRRRPSIATASPRTVRLYVNRTDLDFETVRDLKPAATLELIPPGHQWDETHSGATIDYPLRPAGRFQNVSSITLYFPDNYGMPEGYGASNDMEDWDDDEDRLSTEITFVGFKGKGMGIRRAAVEAVYETRGMKKDHKMPGSEYFGREGV